MQTLIMVGSQQSHTIFTQPPSSTAPNNPGYHGDHNGASDNRSSAFVYPTPPVPAANGPQQRGQQALQSGYVANGHHRPILPKNVCPFPVSSSFGHIQGNTNQTVGPGHQRPLINQFLTNGDVTYASSPANFPMTLYTGQQTPMRPDVYAARENQQNTQVFVQAHNYSMAQVSMCSSRPGNVPQLPASLSRGNCAINQGHLQRAMIRRQSTGGQFSIPAVQDAGAYHSLQDAGDAQLYPSRFQGSVNGDRGAWNNWNEAMRTGRRESLNLPSSVKVAMVEHKGGAWQGMRDFRQEMGSVRGGTKNCEIEQRLNPKFDVQCSTRVQGHIHGTECRGQGLATSGPNSAVPAQNTSLYPQPVDHKLSWTKPFLKGKIDGLLHHLLTTDEWNTEMPQVQAQCGETAIAPHNSLNWSSSQGSRSDKRAMNQHHMATAQQSYPSVPSLSGAVNLPQYHALPTQQGELLSTSLQPPSYSTALGPVARNTQEASNQTYHRGFTMPPPYVSPGTKSRGTGKTVKHIKAKKMANHAPNQPSAFGSEFPDAGSYHQPSVATSTFCQAVQSGRPLCRNQTACNSMTGSERRGVSVTTRPGDAFTVGNESCTGNQPASQAEAQQKSSQMSSAGDSVKLDHRKDHGGTCGAKSPQTDSAPLSHAGSPSPEPVFKPPKIISQQNKSSGSSSCQKAVAVVTPLSPQSWDPADETSSTCQTESDLVCKILNVISLSAESKAGLFDFKMTGTAFESLLISMATGEKDPQNIHSGVPTTVSLGSESTELAVPHQKMTQQVSGSTCRVIPPTADDSATEKIDPQPSNQQKSEPTLPTNPAPQTCEVTPPSGVHFNMSGAQIGVAVHENCDLDGELENAIFDLSSVSTIEWTTAKVAKLITFLHQIEGTPKQEMDVKKTAEIFGLHGYDDLPDVFSSNLYQSIMAEARSVCREGENLVFAQIKPTSLEAVAKNCQILKHCPVRPSEEEDEVVKSNQVLKGKMVRPETVTCRSNRNTPLSTPRSQADSAPVGGTVDALSSIKIGVLPPGETRRIHCDEESEVVKLDNPQRKLPALQGQGDEMSQMEVQPYQWQPEEQQKEVKKVDITSKQMEKSERLEVMESSVGSDGTPAGEHNTISVNEPESTKDDLPEEVLPEENLLEEDQHIGNKALSVSECPQSTPADDSTQEEGNSTVGEAIVSSGEPEEGRDAPDPSECSSSEILFDPDITLQEVIIPVSNVTEVENKNVYSDYEETLKMVAAVSEQRWKEGIAKGELPILLKANVHEVPTSGLEAEDGAASGNMRVSSQGEVPKQLPEPMDIQDLERRLGGQTSLSLRQRLHKRLPSTEKHNHEGENVIRGEKECERRCWEKSPCSMSPVREPQSVKLSEKVEAVIKGIEHCRHNREKPLLVKRKGDHCFASPKAKLPRLHKDIHLSQGRDFEKRQFESKVISSKESPKQKANGGSVYLRLYGSSSKAGDRVVNSCGESVFNSRGKILPAPLTIELSIHSKDSNHSVAIIKNPAKQQVFSNWERSFVPLIHHKRSKSGTSKQDKIKGRSNIGAGTKAANPTVFGDDPKLSRIQCRPQSSSQSTVTIKHRECDKHMGKREEKRNSTPKTVKSHLGKGQESSFVPKASNKHREKSQEKRSVPKTGNKLLGKIQEKKSALPTIRNKHQDKTQEKKSSSVKITENKCSTPQDSPSVRKTCRETRQQDLEKAPLSFRETQAILYKNNRQKTRIPEDKTSCAKCSVGKDTSCSKGKSHGMISAPSHHV